MHNMFQHTNIPWKTVPLTCRIMSLKIDLLQFFHSAVYFRICYKVKRKEYIKCQTSQQVFQGISKPGILNWTCLPFLPSPCKSKAISWLKPIKSQKGGGSITKTACENFVINYDKILTRKQLQIYCVVKRSRVRSQMEDFAQETQLT